MGYSNGAGDARALRWEIDNTRKPISKEFAPHLLFCVFSCNHTLELQVNDYSAYTLYEIQPWKMAEPRGMEIH